MNQFAGFRTEGIVVKIRVHRKQVTRQEKKQKTSSAARRPDSVLHAFIAFDFNTALQRNLYTIPSLENLPIQNSKCL